LSFWINDSSFYSLHYVLVVVSGTSPQVIR
jgi:hypothetical protein